MLAVAKHPLAAAGRRVGAFRRLVRQLDVHVLRGPKRHGGFQALAAAVPKKHPELPPLIDDLADRAAALSDVFQRDMAPFKDLLSAHIQVAEALAENDDTPGAERLWLGEAGETAAHFIEQLYSAAGIIGDIRPAEYPGLLDVLMQGVAVRPKFGAHPRLNIWGLLEARMQHADLVILGGLNEGTWPGEVEANPWMSRQMMAAMGLAPPERKLGLSAHDFTQAFGAPNVLLTRAEKVDGTPSVPSRWLLRMDNLLQCIGAEGLLKSGTPWNQWGRCIGHASTPPSCATT